MGLIHRRDGALGDDLMGFSYSDFAGMIDERRSTDGYAFVLDGAAISQSSKLQDTVAWPYANQEK